MWIVVNIGCIECGVSTDIVGVFTEKEAADAVAEKCDDKYSWRENGQNRFEVFPMPAVDVMNPAYSGINS